MHLQCCTYSWRTKNGVLAIEKMDHFCDMQCSCASKHLFTCSVIHHKQRCLHVYIVRLFVLNTVAVGHTKCKMLEKCYLLNTFGGN